ncbi:MAG: colanic acid biosynthesis glycosyltransferase WcaL [Acidiferrobacteraceae bacterium]|jgi:glycosyltransferase involved in cell wall biosynthesis|nr:colanic acid biosynthesis glycosyltransferase WcaL [Acidiferrobacteraceae bacterium]MDP6397748.1 glycosyltransferase family 4 protein [Arenicellales bacterium]MDP6552475.1 glycosyltransferase family 4 protein [Arenicellales bacterium]MDP6919626.1 glycosyltransferase family 4 protein [Arenicellales bacterium]|tara:strand:+ start:8881 stop:10113 length:1233 start_codon:yes stop_codon:yes gene_type:complete
MPVAVVLKGYPRLSETFIAQEIRSLERAGVDLQLVSLRHPTDPATHPIHGEIKAPVLYLPEYLYREPLRVLKGWLTSRKRPGYKKARSMWIKDLQRDRSANRIRRFGQALVLAAEMPAATSLLYAHFMHTPASVARYAALLNGVPWSFSAHAKDIWTTPAWEKREKLADCAWAVTCTDAGFTHLGELAPPGASLTRLYHGLDTARFTDPGAQGSVSDGSTARQCLNILSVGRAVPKKGFDVLLQALAALPGEFHWQWQHVGGGNALSPLKKAATGLGLDERISWLGPLPQEAVLSLYRESDLFVLPSRIAPGGDRDGLPNVLMEAASQRLAIVTTDLPGIAEFITAEVHGLLVPPADPKALSDAIYRAGINPALREAWSNAARQRVTQEFDHTNNIQPLISLLGRNQGAN